MEAKEITKITDAMRTALANELPDDTELSIGEMSFIVAMFVDTFQQGMVSGSEKDKDAVPLMVIHWLMMANQISVIELATTADIAIPEILGLAERLQSETKGKC